MFAVPGVGKSTFFCTDGTKPSLEREGRGGGERRRGLSFFPLCSVCHPCHSTQATTEKRKLGTTFGLSCAQLLLEREKEKQSLPSFPLVSQALWEVRIGSPPPPHPHPTRARQGSKEAKSSSSLLTSSFSSSSLLLSCDFHLLFPQSY